MRNYFATLVRDLFKQFTMIHLHVRKCMSKFLDFSHGSIYCFFLFVLMKVIVERPEQQWEQENDAAAKT